MKKNRLFFMFAALFVSAAVLFSCQKEEVASLEDGVMLKSLTIANGEAASCEADCIEPESSTFYPVSDMASLSVGENTKSVSYSAYNTETNFVVEVDYTITAGPADAKATIVIAIGGDEVEYTEVSSGSTVSHTVPLADGWAGCDEVAFSMVQEGLGTPITFSESYTLIPVCAEESLEIGMEYQGGIIAYILQPGDPGYVENETHGLIAAPSDYGGGLPWSTGSSTTTGATGTDLGTGLANTIAITANQGSGPIVAFYAAFVCAAYSVTVGATTYNDWYLPSRDELNKLYENKEAIGVSNVRYWSSTEFGSSSALEQYFLNGKQSSDSKGAYLRVRAVRAF